LIAATLAAVAATMMMAAVPTTAARATLISTTLATVSSTMMVTAVAFITPLEWQLRSAEFLEELSDLRCDAAWKSIRQIEIFREPAVLMSGDDAVEEGTCTRSASLRLCGNRCQQQHRARAEPAAHQLLFRSLHGSPQSSALSNFSSL
jgi:hypothetical protein